MEKQNSQIVWMLRIITLSMVGVFAIILVTAVRLGGTIAKVDLVMTDLESTTKQLEVVSDQLATVDWVTLTDNINTAAETAQVSMVEAMGTLNDLDIDSLNKAIVDLKKVVEPLANFTSKFG